MPRDGDIAALRGTQEAGADALRAGSRSLERENGEMPGVQEVLAGRYELLEVAGRGRMCVVFRTRDRALPTRVYRPMGSR